MFTNHKNLFVMKRITSLFLFMFTIALINAQTYSEALRYSTLEVGGTARTIGIGGAIGALGADFSSLGVNPAGLANYQRSELTITPNFDRVSINARLDGNEQNKTVTTEKSKFLLNNIGYVAVSHPGGTDLTTFNFGLGINKKASFSNKFFYSGLSKGSLTDRFLEQENGGESNPDESQLAKKTLAILEGSDGFYESDFSARPEAMIKKNQQVSSEGGITEMVFSFAGNFNNKLSIGATLGVPFLRFEETKTYREEKSDDNNIEFFDELEFVEKLTTSGTGLNLKLGAIYKINKIFRIGAAYQTRTRFSLEDYSFNTFLYGYTDADGSVVNTAESPDNGLTFNYKLKTPSRLTGSVAAIFGKSGFLSADVEYVDYHKASYLFDAGSEEDVNVQRETNDTIQSKLSSAINIRIGGEYVFYKKMFRIRGGYGINGTPYAGDTNTQNFYTVGLGYRGDNMFVDFAYKRTATDEGFIPYLTSRAYQQYVDKDITAEDFVLTVGFRF